jgi:hypothetical protein
MLSRRSIDMMLDLIENRVACMQVVDREDHRQLAILTQARRELLAIRAQAPRGSGANGPVAAAAATPVEAATAAAAVAAAAASAGAARAAALS